MTVNPLFLTAAMALIGVIFLIPILVYFWPQIKLFDNQKLIWLILAGLLWIALGEILFVVGLSKATLVNASLLALTFPLFAILIGAIFLKEVIGVKFIIASVLMVAGYLLLVF